MALRRLLAVSAAVVLGSCLPVLAQESAGGAAGEQPSEAKSPLVKRTRLAVGDAAPKLEHVNWLKGGPVTSWEPGKVYVLDFWATWCGPCRRAIPHLAKVAKDHADKNVVVIGLAVWPRDGMEPTKAFVDGMGDKMPYLIAEDIDDRTGDAFMRASGQNGIPTLMIVDQKGVLAWIGHPTPEFDKVLAKVVAGGFDGVAYQEKQKALFAKADGINARLQAAAKEKNWPECVTLFDEFLALDGEQFIEFNLYKYDVLATKLKDQEAAKAHGRSIVSGALADNSMLLNALAWFIVDPKGQVPAESRDLELALMASQRASELTGGDDASVLDTMARVQFAKGDVAGAIATQTKAIEHAEGDDMKADFKRTLAEYEAAGKAAG